MRLLITRPSPGGEATAARAAALGAEPILLPLLVTEPRAWALPAGAPDAVMLTSAAGARHAGPVAEPLYPLPLFAVGAATAGAARSVGFSDVRSGEATVQLLVDTIAVAGFTRLLHLAGVDRTPVVAPPGLAVTIVPVYRARLVAVPTLPAFDWALLYSVRTAAHFAAECDRLGHPRAQTRIAALSAAVAAAAGPGWAATAIAAAPSEAALLAAIGMTWQEPR